MIQRIAVLAIATAAMASVATSFAQQAGSGTDVEAMTVEARKVAIDLVGQIGGELKRAFEFSGPLRAVVVCKYSVPELSSNLSRQTGWRVTRVSLRPRNPTLGMPDAWEQGVLQYFDQRVAYGGAADMLEYSEVVNEPNGRYFRYMRALPTGELCLACHGPVEGITKAIKAQLAMEYPHDRATGFELGQVRGAVTIKRLLPRP